MTTPVYQQVLSLEHVADRIAAKIIMALEANRRVFWLVPGGSSIAIAALASKKIATTAHDKLTVTLTDERYGPIDHSDSNWRQLKEAGFSLPEARMLPVLTGKSRQDTVDQFAGILKDEIAAADYVLGFFGIGPDGHTAGILPHSVASVASEFVAAYDASRFIRVTITPPAITLLNEAVVYATGREKWPTLYALQELHSIEEQPAQALRQVPALTIFSDYRGEKE